MKRRWSCARMHHHWCTWMMLLVSAVVQASDPRITLSSNKIVQSRVSDTNRHLQYIIIRPPQDLPIPEPSNDEDSDTDGFARPTTFYICNHVPASNNDNNPVQSVDLLFTYKVETDQSNAVLPLDWIETTLPSFVTGTMIEALATALCSSRRAVEEGVRRGLTESTLASCIYSISAGQPDTAMEVCDDNQGDGGCMLYGGDIRITHKPSCASQEVQIAALTALEGNIGSDEALESINSRLVSDGVMVTNVEIYSNLADIGAPVVSEVEDSSKSNDGLTPGGMVVVVLSVLLVVALLAFLFAWRRSVWLRQLQMEDDLKSVRTHWSGSDDNSESGGFRREDMHDLALRHSKLDVHRCQSALCAVCRNNNNLGQVHMLRLNRLSSMDLAPECYDATYNEPIEPNFEDEAVDESVEDIVSTKRHFPAPPRIWHRADNNKTGPVVESQAVSFVRVANAREGHIDDNTQPSIML